MSCLQKPSISVRSALELADRTKKNRVKHRRLIQLFFAAASNSYVTGFATGMIYQGDLKKVCSPGLNCYSCPGALMSCPIGSLQAVLGSRSFQLSTYVFGMILAFGALLGRMVCGFLCPFGLVQELLFKIPFVKKIKHFKGDRVLRSLKYVFLVLLVILLPMLTKASGDSSPYFCKYVCPAGALEAGIPYIIHEQLGTGGAAGGTGALPAVTGLTTLPDIGNAIIKPAAIGLPAKGGELGFLFGWKMGILAVVVLLSVMMYRPFCKYVCPLGAMYGLLNPVSLYRLRFSQDACIKCGKCARACGMCLDPTKELNHAECVRCGDCVNVCPTDALSMGFGDGKLSQKGVLSKQA